MLSNFKTGEQIFSEVGEAAAKISEHLDLAKTAIILGSGLMALTKSLTDAKSLPYNDIPYAPQSTVIGHSATMYSGKLAGKPVILMAGRYHYYEGHSPSDIIAPVRWLAQLGVEQIIITNAAGGINEGFQPPTLMVIKDHINYQGFNPLIGPNVEQFGARFPDMSEPYNRDLAAIALAKGKELAINIAEGIYIAFPGPSYETPAEIKMARIMGADAVGMSTVPEAIAANHLGLKVLGISCITNPAAGLNQNPLTHEEVLEASKQAEQDFAALICAIVEQIG